MVLCAIMGNQFQGFPGEKRRGSRKKGVPGSPRDSRSLLAEYHFMGVSAHVCILKVALIQTLPML